MYKINSKNAFYDLESFEKILKEHDINVFVDFESDPETLFLSFPDITEEQVKNEYPFDFDTENETFHFDLSKFAEYVPIVRLDHRDVGNDALTFLEALQGVLRVYNYRLIDVNTHGDDYVYFLSKSEDDKAEAHIKNALKIHVSEINTDMIQEKEPVIVGKLEFKDIQKILYQNLTPKSANLYILRDLLEDINPNMQYEVIEDERGNNYIKETPYSN